MLCPRDHYLNNGDCLPLYNKLEGLGTHFLISIKTSRQIKKSENGEFILKLQQFFYVSLNTTLTPSICHTSIWYLPKLKSKPNTGYYILSVSLNGTNDSMFGEIVQQVRNFWTTLTSKTSIKLTNSSSVTLSFEFAHQTVQFKRNVMDVATGMYLRALVGSHLPGSKCGVCKEVSDRNWCYHTILNDREIKSIAHTHIVLNGSDKVLFSPQFDILLQNNLVNVVTCIDELDEQNDNGIIINDDVLENMLEEMEDDWFVSDTAISVWICLVLVIFGVVLQTLLRKYVNRAPSP